MRKRKCHVCSKGMDTAFGSWHSNLTGVTDKCGRGQLNQLGSQLGGWEVKDQGLVQSVVHLQTAINCALRQQPPNSDLLWQ